MSHLGEIATPLGAPEASPEPNTDSFYETGRPRLGGVARPVHFSDDQIETLNAVADTMIPPGAGFPAPSEVDVVGFIGRYVTPTGYRNKHYPFACEDAFKAGLDKLGAGSRGQDSGSTGSGLEEAISTLEKAEDPLFVQLRALIYYGYYSRREVVQAIRQNIPAGKDYHGPPLPYGYLEVTPEWTEELLAAAGKGGSYIATDDVKRVDLSKLSWKK